MDKDEVFNLNISPPVHFEALFQKNFAKKLKAHSLWVVELDLTWVNHWNWSSVMGNQSSSCTAWKRVVNQPLPNWTILEVVVKCDYQVLLHFLPLPQKVFAEL